MDRCGGGAKPRRAGGGVRRPADEPNDAADACLGTGNLPPAKVRGLKLAVNFCEPPYCLLVSGWQLTRNDFRKGFVCLFYS